MAPIDPNAALTVIAAGVVLGAVVSYWGIMWVLGMRGFPKPRES